MEKFNIRSCTGSPEIADSIYFFSNQHIHSQHTHLIFLVIFHASGRHFALCIDLMCVQQTHTVATYVVTGVRHQSYLFARDSRIALLLHRRKSPTFSPSRWIRFSPFMFYNSLRHDRGFCSRNFQPK